jgi:two-component system sensor histidine kinase CiaH
MIKRLRKKFILIAMFSVSFVLLVVLGLLNIINYVQTSKNSENILNYLANNNGYFPTYEDKSSSRRSEFGFDFTEETPFETRYFTVLADSSGTVTQINMSHIAAVSATDAYQYAQQVLSRGNTSGMINSYMYLVKDQDDGGQYIVFLDRRAEVESQSQLMFLSLMIAVLSLSVVFLLVSLLSKKVIKPVLENMDKQKQFITDAGHEIKTPLAIISADTDVIEIESGKTEWTDSIRNQTVRLGELIQSMLTLAKMEDSDMTDKFTVFSISELAEDVAGEFRPIAVNDDVTFDTEITPDMEMNGSYQEIRQLMSVLLNNAFKYTNEHGDVILRLYKKSRSVILEVENTADNLPDGDLSKLFDRFYRADNARSRETGGYGIGLSIARAAAEHHKGSIQAKKVNDHLIRFSAVLNS